MSREGRACKIGVQRVGKAVVAAALFGAVYLTAISVLANYVAQYGVSEGGRHPYLVLAIWSLLPFAFMIPSALLCRLNFCRGRWIVAGVTLCASMIVWLPRLMTVARDRAYDYGEPLTCLCKYAFSYELFISGAIIAIVLLCRWKRIGLCVLGASVLLVGTHAYLLYDLPWGKPDPRFDIPLPFETIKQNDALAQTNRPWMSPCDAVEAYVKFHEIGVRRQALRFAERYFSLELKLGIIPESQLQNLTVEKLRSKLMAAYKAFDYRGNVFAR